MINTDIKLINKLINKYLIDFNFAQSIYIDLYSKNLIDNLEENIDKIDNFNNFIDFYYRKELYE